MTRIFNSFSDLIGNTPLLELHNYRRNRQLGARILAKIEYFNPAGSVKDRIAWGIVKHAEEAGKIRPGDLLVDVTSGNTGIGLAAVAASRGYRTKFYLSDNISPDKVKLLRLFGAEIVTVKNEFFLDPQALDKISLRVQEENPGAFFTDQLANPANPRTHFETTGPEIWRDTDGAVDIFVAGVGTGGTISGAGGFLKSKKPGLKVVIAEPAEASLPTDVNPYPDEIDGVHKVSEVPREQLPRNFDSTIADEVIALNTSDARKTAQSLVAEEGIFAGTSAGAVLFAATQLALRPENAGKIIVAVLPDTGERYLTAAGEPAVSVDTAAIRDKVDLHS
ncbi:cysteine synthase family protein [Neorhizobium sp. P12A]|uniref:PLP-dependent cysteine synthase family protein n=1 Tax=Neorhizobium sp. P12A TaxID=2268027 RepID=UPI0011EFA2D7|nr:cysteine synthase family protein [Neorhizobium sp. P12A]KAA0693356.1 cysteine synthase family protein [Neorhizobium sp. P12A]